MKQDDVVEVVRKDSLRIAKERLQKARDDITQSIQDIIDLQTDTLSAQHSDLADELDHIGILEKKLDDFMQKPEWGDNPPEDREEWRRGYEAAQDVLRIKLSTWYPFGGPFSLTALRSNRAACECGYTQALKGDKQS